MVENTVTINGIDVDAESLLKAAEQLSEESDHEGSVIVGDIFIRRSSFLLDGCKLFVEGEGTRIAYKPVEEFIEMAENAIKVPFEEYVNNLTKVGAECEIGKTLKNKHAGSFRRGYDILVWKDYSFTAKMMEELIEDDGIEVGYVQLVDSGVMVGLNDIREE